MSTGPVNPALLHSPITGPPPEMASLGGSTTGMSGSLPIPGQRFSDLLIESSQAPTFSKHALERLRRRGITLTAQTLGRLTEGIQRAAGKGARNSVVFVDGTAFVASVQNNTVITAVTPEHMRSQVFTNIDSAVIA